jgi:hypothetical protein
MLVIFQNAGNGVQYSRIRHIAGHEGTEVIVVPERANERLNILRLALAAVESGCSIQI